jgi:NADP-dependent aldehyde dehydrogenase
MNHPSDTSPAELDTILGRARAASPSLAAMCLKQRANGLLNIAARLEESRNELVEQAILETGLSSQRLRGELTRTIVQLKLFADIARAGEFLDVRIDQADPEFVLGSRPDLRRYLVPVGPVVNFTASNFPFAFSVAGGDTASALAAGCPVIVKAHPGHPLLSALTGRLITTALTDSGFPDGAIAVVFGQENGLSVLKDDRVRAAAFTGSFRAGRTLATAAAQRRSPIPFYGELGSVNPVFATPTAVEENAQALAAQYVASVAGSAGQLCTKPGFLFAPSSSELATTIRKAAEEHPQQRMLYPGLGAAYASRRTDILDTPGVSVIVEGSVRVDADDQVWATPTIVATSPATLREYRERLIDEAFGPLSVVVNYAENDNLAELSAEFFEGNLTGTIHLGENEDPIRVRELVDELATSTGRVIIGGWPTGVAVTPAMQHGGPYPATTNVSSTSVGSAAISRFLRPVTYQDAPQQILPEPLQDANPWAVPQTIASRGESLSWGSRGAAVPPTE